MRLVVGLHAEGRHVLFGTALRQRRQDGDALGQADDLLVELPGLLRGPAPRASAAPRVVELEAGDAVLAGGEQDEPVFLPFLMRGTVENIKAPLMIYYNFLNSPDFIKDLLSCFF